MMPPPTILYAHEGPAKKSTSSQPSTHTTVPRFTPRLVTHTPLPRTGVILLPKLLRAVRLVRRAAIARGGTVTPVAGWPTMGRAQHGLTRIRRGSIVTRVLAVAHGRASVGGDPGAVIIVVVDSLALAAAAVGVALVAAGGGTQGVEFGGAKVGLGFDEGASVVAHGLVARVGVLGDQGPDRGPDDHEQDDGGKDDVDDEEEDAHDADGELGDIEDVGEEEEEDDVEEVDAGDGDVERVGFSVHVRPEDGDGDQQGGFDDDESDGLHGARGLAKGDEHALDRYIGEHDEDEVVHGGFELHVQKPPLVERLRVRIEDVCRVLVQGNAAACDAPHLDGCPGENGCDGDDHRDGEHDLGGRVTLGYFPEAEDDHLRETDEYLFFAVRVSKCM